MSDWNLERATRTLSGVNWKTDDRNFTEEETEAVVWAARACYQGEVTMTQFSQLLGGLPIEALLTSMYKL